MEALGYGSGFVDAVKLILFSVDGQKAESVMLSMWSSGRNVGPSGGVMFISGPRKELERNPPARERRTPFRLSRVGNANNRGTGAGEYISSTTP